MAALAIGAFAVHRGRREAAAVRSAGRSARAAPDRGAGPSTLAQASAINGRRLNASAALLAASVLCDSGLEHYRGSFRNRAMYTPLGASAAALTASLYGVVDNRADSHRGRDAVYALSALVGLVGVAFHAYNVRKRPGGVSWLNLFYGAPIGAPVALGLSGLLGRAAERVREAPKNTPGKLFGGPADEVLSAICILGLLGDSAEAALLHFRGAYHDPFMVLPVTVPPLAAFALARATAERSAGALSAARWSLRATAALGFLGVGFHAYGISRNMGGWSNWSQNILDGPPLPAPPSFTGLAVAGLACVVLLEEGRNADTLPRI
jgi:hypothetical protein